MQVAHHLNEPPRKDILNSVLRQLDSLSKCMGVLESVVGGGTTRIKPCKRKPFKLEDVPDDVLFIVIDQFDSPSAPFDLYPIRDVKTLRSLRCVNKRFANLSAKCTFSVVSIGVCSRLHNIPNSVIQYARHLIIRDFAFVVDQSHWCPLLSARIISIQCSGDRFMPFWGGLASLLLSSGGQMISHLRLPINFMSMDNTIDLYDFRMVLSILSSTVSDLSLDLRASTSKNKHSLFIVREELKALRTLQFVNLENYNEAILEARWSSALTLRKLIFSHCEVALPLVSQFIANSPNVDNLIFHDSCLRNAPEGVTYMMLNINRKFTCFETLRTES